MPDPLSPKFLLVIVMALVLGFVSTCKRGNQIIGLLVGCMIVSIGIAGLATGRIQQRWHGAPPLEGPLAIFGSVIMLTFGLYIAYQMATKR